MYRVECEEAALETGWPGRSRFRHLGCDFNCQTSGARFTLLEVNSQCGPLGGSKVPAQYALQTADDRDNLPWMSSGHSDDGASASRFKPVRAIAPYGRNAKNSLVLCQQCLLAGRPGLRE